MEGARLLVAVSFSRRDGGGRSRLDGSRAPVSHRSAPAERRRHPTSRSYGARPPRVASSAATSTGAVSGSPPPTLSSVWGPRGSQGAPAGRDIAVKAFWTSTASHPHGCAPREASWYRCEPHRYDGALRARPAEVRGEENAPSSRPGSAPPIARRERATDRRVEACLADDGSERDAGAVFENDRGLQTSVSTCLGRSCAPRSADRRRVECPPRLGSARRRLLAGGSGRLVHRFGARGGHPRASVGSSYDVRHSGCPTTGFLNRIRPVVPRASWSAPSGADDRCAVTREPARRSSDRDMECQRPVRRHRSAARIEADVG